MSSEVGAAANESEATAIRAKYEAAEAAIEHEMDHKPLEMHMSLAIAYNVSLPLFPTKKSFYVLAYSMLTFTSSLSVRCLTVPVQVDRHCTILAGSRDQLVYTKRTKSSLLF